jgi:hypothetical protein
MKALQYLRKHNAAPALDRQVLLSTVIYFTNTFFNSHTIMEPDCLEWVQRGNWVEGGSHELFDERCDLILYATAGDVRALTPFLVKQDDQTLYELFVELISLLVMYQAMSEDDSPSYNYDHLKDPVQWAKLWNRYLGIEDKENLWDNKSQIIESLTTDGRYVENMQEIIESLTEGILDKAFELATDFHKFMKTQEKVEEVGGAYELDQYSSIEGCHIRVIDLALTNPEDDEFYSCLLYWAPHPRIDAPEEAPEEIKEVCKAWSSKKRTEWFDGLTSNRQSSRELEVAG